MSGFTFNPPNTDAAPPADPPAADVVAAGGWWPDVNITGVRQAVDLNTNVTPERVRDAVRQAIVDLASEPAMSAWRRDQVAAGFTKLSVVPSRDIEVDGQSDYCLRWTRAVYSLVAADLGERLLGQGLTKAGADRAEALGAEVGLHQRNVTHAVRDFLGRPRIRARMI
ncbi:MAG: head completion/stabilization protein [Brevundimonas sp.]|uniref:head completion/stabilization protein n=1 Tax=Brevundimonas sp. TaxID=1871086 RepID=UPI002717DB67|nr:head completion/stabilization protein [Brevundimonas sp.]MDO9607232.1 head completion/stabilization protein [Brevundimonas sp.]